MKAQTEELSALKIELIKSSPSAPVIPFKPNECLMHEKLVVELKKRTTSRSESQSWIN